MCDVHWCITVDYQQIENGNIANQIHGFTIDYIKFILMSSRFNTCESLEQIEKAVKTLTQWLVFPQNFLFFQTSTCVSLTR